MEDKNEKTAYLEFSDVEKKNSKFINILIVFLVVALVGGLGYFGYKKLTTKTPKEIYVSNIKSAIKKINNAVDTASKYYQSQFKGNIKVEGLLFTMSGFDVINDYELTVSSKIDDSNKIALSSLIVNDTKSNNKFDANMYIKDGDIYLDLKDTYDGLIKLTSDSDEETRSLIKNALNDYSNNNYAKFTYLIEKVSDLYVSTLKDEEFKEESTTISVNGKSKNVIATSLVYTEEKANKTLKTVIKGLLDDEVSISYLASITSTSIEEVRSSLTDMLNDEEEFDNNEVLNIIIYTRNGKFAGIDISMDDNKFRYYDIDKDLEIGLSNTFLIVGSYENGGKITASYNVEGNEIELLNLTVNNLSINNLDIDYKISDKLFESSGTKMSIYGNIKDSKSINQNSANEKLTLSISYDVEGMSSKITANLNITQDSKQPNIDVDLTNAIDANDEIMIEIGNAVGEKIKSFSIYKAISESTSSETLTPIIYDGEDAI